MKKFISIIPIVLICFIALNTFQVHASEIQQKEKKKGSFCDQTGCYRSSRQIPIHVAVKGSDLKEVMRLVEEGEDLNERDFSGTTALSISILSNQPKMTEYLITHGAEPNASTKLVRDLIKKGDIKTIELLLNRGAKIDGPPNTIWPDEIPLLEAIQNKKIDISLLLIKRGANVNIEPNRKSKDYHTALALTAYDVRLLTVLKALLDAGADPNKKAILDITPLHCAAEANNIEAVRLLVGKGADINAKDDTGFTPIMKTFSKNRKDKTRELPTLKLLLASGADINSVFECLNQSGWQMNTGDTLLNFAVADGTIESIKWLIHSKVNVNSRNNNGNTPLHYAVMSGNLVVTDLLLNNGADARVKNSRGEDSVYFALNNRYDTKRQEAFKKIFRKYKYIE